MGRNYEKTRQVNRIKKIRLLMKKYLLFIIIFSASIRIDAQIEQTLTNKYQLAQSFEQDGQLEKAALLFLELYNAQPANPIYMDDLNRVYLKQKKYDKSVQLLLDGIKARPSDITLYGLLGSTYFIMDQKDKAHEVWENGIKSSGGSVTSYRLIANYALQNRDFEAAIKYLKTAKEKSPDPLIFSYDLANIYTAQMDFASAIKEYCELISQKPDQIGAVKSRIQSYMSRPGSIEQSIDAVNNFLKDNSKPVLYDLLTFLYQQLGNYEAALNSIIKYDNMINARGVQIFGFAQEAMRNKAYKQAASGYKLIIEKYDNSPLLPLARLGYTKTLEASTDLKYSDSLNNWKPYKQLKAVGKEDYLKVINAYKDLFTQNKGNAIQDEVVYHMALIYKDKLLDNQKADSLFKEVIKISPLSEYAVNSRIELGKILILEGNLGAAREFFNQVAENPRTSPDTKNEASYYVGKILFWSGKFKEALSKINEVQSNLSSSYSNDAISLSLLIGTSRNDSTSLINFAEADLLAEQNNIEEAIKKIKDLPEKTSSPVLKDLAAFRYAELLIAKNEYPTAIKILEVIAVQNPPKVYSDRSMFLLGEIYQFAVNDQVKALENYQKLLENFPNSLYFDYVRERINSIKTQGG